MTDGGLRGIANRRHVGPESCSEAPGEIHIGSDE